MTEVDPSLKGVVQIQLTETGALWKRKYIDKSPLRVSDGELIDIYTSGMELVTLLPEDDRFDVLIAYSTSLGISLKREQEPVKSINQPGFNKRPSVAHNNFIKGIVEKELERLTPIRHAARRLIENLVNEVAYVTPEVMLYIISHHDLGISLPPRFRDLTSEMFIYIFEEANKSVLTSSDGWLHLEGIARAHAMFLRPPEVVAEEQNLPPETSKEEGIMEPMLMVQDQSKNWSKRKFERKSKGKQKSRKDFDDEEY